MSTSTSGRVFSGVFSDLITGCEGSDGLVMVALVDFEELKLKLCLSEGVVDDEVYGCFMHQVRRRPDVAEAEPRQGSRRSLTSIFERNKSLVLSRSACAGVTIGVIPDLSPTSSWKTAGISSQSLYDRKHA